MSNSKKEKLIKYINFQLNDLKNQHEDSEIKRGEYLARKDELECMLTFVDSIYGGEDE